MNDVSKQRASPAAAVTEQDDYSPLPPTRQAGVCMHLTSLPGPYGIGEIGAGALRFIDTLAACGLNVWQFLPLGPTAYGDSPYQSLSTFAGNELLIDIQELVDLGLVSAVEVSELRELPGDRVDYGALIPLKNQLLAQAAQRFEARASASLKAKCESFVVQHSDRWLHDYALYRILKYRHGHQAWPQWETPFLRRDPEAIQYVEEVSADQIAEIKIIQFFFYHQWRRLRTYAAERGVRLFGDMPIYIAFDSADAWAHPELLRIDENGRPNRVAGVPPDYFSEEGQLWGNPLYDWDYHAKGGYGWWIARMRHARTLMDMVRVDHFRGFESFWSIPADASSAREGRWEQGPGDAIFEAMEHALGRLPIIAEDLGDITDEVDALRERRRIPGMKVLQFLAAVKDFELSSIPDRSVCYTGTHDNDTVVGWYRGGPGDVRTKAEIRREQRAVRAHTRGKAKTIHQDLIRLAFSSQARIAIALMQDFLGLGSDARMNIPGTCGNNWRWRLRADQLSPEVCASIREMVNASGRL